MSILNNPDAGRDIGPEPQPISEWKLERYLLGELPADEMRALKARIDSDPVCAQSLEALRAELGALEAAHPAATMAEGIARRLARVERTTAARPAPSLAPARLLDLLRTPRAAWIPALGLLALLAVLPLSPWRNPNSAGPGAAGDGPMETTRLKGLKSHQGHQPGLLLHRRTPGGPARLRGGDGARAGDLIQIQYESAGRPYGAILSLDAEGSVTRHLPDTGERSAPLADGGPVALPFAYELDDAPGWERFWLITSDRPFAVAEAEAALKRLMPGVMPPDSLPLPAGLDQTAFTLLKDSGT